MPSFTNRDCAERLWTVSASILGEDGVLVGTSPAVRVELHKADTFYSQWCTSDPARPAFQTASVRPARNLLRGGGEITGGAGEDRGVETYSTARLQAWVNVSAADLALPTYGNGETSELAARGLYGDYALFFPAASLRRPLRGGGDSDGLDLSRVDDVLLRIDFVSVARP